MGKCGIFYIWSFLLLSSRYIYIPLGGSRQGIFRQVVSSVATFAYVYYWHGAYDYLLYWAILQWCGVFIEAMTAKLLKTKRLRYLEVIIVIKIIEHWVVIASVSLLRLLFNLILARGSFPSYNKTSPCSGWNIYHYCSNIK